MQIKKPLLLAVSLLIIYTVSADNMGGHFGRQMSSNGDDKKFSFSFNAGMGIPMGDFGRKAALPNNDSTHAYGFANNGFHFDVGVSWRFIDYVGVAARIGGSICSFDANAFASAYNIPTATESVSAQGSHYIGEYFLGPFLHLPCGDMFSVELKVMAGLISAQYPDIEIASTVPNNLAGEDFKYAHAQDFGYCLALSGRYKLDDLIGLCATVSYMGTTFDYNGAAYLYSTPSGYQYTTISNSDRRSSFSMVTATFGMTINF